MRRAASAAVRGVGAVAALWLAAAVPALAQPAPATDYDDRIIDACLSEHWGGQNAQESCIGIAARACMPPGEGDAAIAIACFDAERAQWDTRLTETLDALRGQFGPVEATPEAAETPTDTPSETATEMPGDLLVALIAMQTAWESWRDAACGFDGAVYPGSPIGDTARADCMMRLTARQVFHLMARLDGDI